MNNNKMMFEYENEIYKISELKKSKSPLISEVILDNFTNKAQENFDFDFDGKNKFYPFEFNDILKELDFQILVITGASGSGKSTFSKYFGKEEQIEWNNKKAIISNFDNPNDAVEKLIATGLNSIPTWCKPRNVLSVGEGFRADLARKLKSNCVIDEFTSTVDRNVALSCSVSISKYIRKNNLQKCVFVSCHKDFIDFLCPDYVIDLDDEAIFDTRRLPRKKIDIQIFERKNKREIWNIFRQHHYLSEELNIASHLYCAYWNDTLIGMCAILPQPSGNYQNAFRIHRLVILPDYQGLGVGVKLLESICDIYKYHNKTMYLRTSHVKLLNYMKNSNKWFGNGKLEYSKQETGLLKNKKIIANRKSASYKYNLECKNDKNIKYDLIDYLKKQTIDETIINQINLF